MVTLESAAGRSCLINLDAKQTGKPIAGNRRDRFEVAETGNRLTVRILRHSRRKREAPARLNLRSTAPLFDPTTTLSILAAFVCRCRSPYDWRGLLTAASVRIATSFVFAVVERSPWICAAGCVHSSLSRQGPLRRSAKRGQDQDCLWLGEVRLLDFARLHVQLPPNVIALCPDLPEEALVAVHPEYKLGF